MAQGVRAVFAAAALLVAAGCATPSYEDVQPRSGAEVTFTNASDKAAEMQLFLGPDCTGRRPIRSPRDQSSQLDANQSRAFLFPPGKPFTVELAYPIKKDGYFWNGREQKQYCRQMYTFAPEDKAYAVVFSLGEASCGAELYAAGADGLTRLNASDYLKPRVHRVSLGGDGPWCEAR